MRAPYTQLYVHCVWATWDRLPLIPASCEPEFYASIAAKCHTLDCAPLAIGGIDNHVHLLVRLSAALAVATLVKEVKGTSSHLMTHILQPGVFFRWQGAYGAFTVYKDNVEDVSEYIKHQKTHHASNELIPDWEHCEEYLGG